MRSMLALLGLALGLACGASVARQAPVEPLPAAGSEGDDADGLVARLSQATLADGIDLSVAAAALRDDEADGGDAPFGGALYAGYQFRYDYANASPTPAGVAPTPYEGYESTTVTAAGAIEGRVTWPSPPRAAAALPSPCGPIANDSLQLGAGRAVAGAVVWLDDIERGRSTMPIGGLLERRDCRVWPHVAVIAPIGTRTRLINSDPMPWSPVARDADGALFELTVDGRGREASATVTRAGLFSVRGGGDPAGAWLVAMRHPYYGVTDDDGRFRLFEVPPGRYRLVVWHPPVVTGVDGDGQPIATAPVRVERAVTVRADAVTALDVRLSGR